MTEHRRPTALVTGASSGIGLAFAHVFAERGFDLVVTARRRQRLDELARELAGRHGTATTTIFADLRDPSAPAHVVSEIEAAGVVVDALVNNAGYGVCERVHETTDREMRDIFDVNYFGVFYGCKAVAPRMIAQGSGHIFNVSSVLGHRGMPFQGAYCATKFGVVGFTQQLATELARHNIRVNCIAPGSHSTDMMDGTIGRTAAKFGITTEQVTSGIRSAALLGRQGLPSELAASVSFVAGDDSSFATGQTLNVDGGAHMS